MAGVNQHKEEIKEINSLLDQLNGKIVAISNSLAGMNKTASSPSGLAKNTESTAKSLEKLSKAEKEVLKTSRQLEATKKSLAAQQLKEFRNTQRFVAQSEKEAKQIAHAERAYIKLNKQLADATKRYQDLTSKKALGEKLNAKEIRELDKLEIKLKHLGKAYQEVDRSLITATGGVKRAASSFDSLGFSVSQITRESPAFINSMQTGFMAISNNIPILVDEINKLQRANVQLAKDGKPTVNILKSLGKALFSWQSLISAGIVLLTLYGSKIVEWVDTMIRGEKATKESAEAQEKFNQSIQASNKELFNIQKLVKEITVLNEANVDRQAMIDKLIDDYPDFIDFIDSEKTSNAELEAGIKKLNQEYVKKLVLMKFQQKIDAQADVLADKKVTQILEEGDALLLLNNLNKKYFKGKVDLENKSASEQIKTLKKSFEKQGDIYSNGYKKILELRKILIGKSSDVTTEQLVLGGLEKDLQNAENILGASYNSLNSIFGENEDFGVTITMDKIEKKFIDIKDAIDDFEGGGKIFEEFARNLSQSDLETVLSGYEKEVKKLSESLLDFDMSDSERATTEALKLEFQDRLSLLRDFIKDYKESYESIEEVVENDEIADSIPKVGWLDKLLYGEDGDSVMFRNKLTMTLQAVSNMIGSISDITAGLFERRIQRIEEEKEAVDDKYNNDLEKIEETALSEEQKDARKKALEKENRRDQEILDKKIAKEKTKQAKIDKGAALSQAAISTAVAAINAATIQPVYLAPAAVAFALALGAAQIAAIAAQPIPKYAKGTESHKGGFAYVGDGGKSEAAILPDGSVWKTPAKETLTYLPKGTTVKPDYDQFEKEAQKSAWQYSLELNFRRKDDDMSRFKDELRNDIVKSLSGIKINNHSHEVGEAVKQAIEQSKWESNFA